MLKLKKNEPNFKDLIEYSLLVFGYVIIDDFFSEYDDLFKRLKSKHLKDLSINNVASDNNYRGGVCKTFFDLLEKKETKKSLSAQIKNPIMELN